MGVPRAISLIIRLSKSLRCSVLALISWGMDVRYAHRMLDCLALLTFSDYESNLIKHILVRKIN
jgi:hypothetical protein